MSSFTIFRVADGRIRALVTCPEKAIRQQIGDGEEAIEGHPSEVGCLYVRRAGEGWEFDDGRLPEPPEGEGAQWDESALKWSTRIQRSEEARARRQAALAASDWTQMPDVEMGPAQAAAWRAYRKALRDVTDQPGFPDSIQWPEPPTERPGEQSNHNENLGKK
jgi:hypothetical protein